MSRITQLSSALVAAGAIFCNPAEAGQRSFVSSTGNDANTASSCVATSPCRSFTAAHGITNDGGEIIALDAAGYGAVTITKSISIIANPGFYAGITAATGNAVTVNTTGTVILRGLNLNGLGATNGVSMGTAGTLVIENCVIANFSASGVSVIGTGSVRVSDSVIRGNLDGIFAQGGAQVDVVRTKFSGHAQTSVWINGDIDGTTTTGTVNDSQAVGNFLGFVAANFSGTTGISRLTVNRSSASGMSLAGFLVQRGGATGASTITVSGSTASGNAQGFANASSSGVFESLGNNTVRNNATNATAGITVISGT